MKKPQNAIVYTRYSPRPKGGEASIETQSHYCHEYAQKNNLNIIAEYSDRAKSGDDENRPELWEAVNQMQAGMVLLVYKFDRLSRDIYLFESIRRAVERKGGTIISTTPGEPFGNDPTTIAIQQILQVFANMEKKIHAQRVSAAMKYRLSRGEKMTRCAPVGYRWDPEHPNRMIPDIQEMAAVGRIVELYNQGARCQKIATIMNKEGFIPRGKKWHRNTVERILKNKDNGYYNNVVI